MFKIQVQLVPNSKEMLIEQECKCRNTFALTLFVSTFTIYSVSLTYIIKLILHPFLASRKTESSPTPTTCEKYLLNFTVSLYIVSVCLLRNYNCHISPIICSFGSHMFIHLPRSFPCNLDIPTPGGGRVQ